MPKHHWHVQHIETPAGKLFVRHREGAGLPLVMWPSVFYDHSLYQGMLEWLDNPAVLIDPPGHGNSRECPPSLDVDACARSVEDILRVLGLHEAVLVGTSWGGLVGVRLARLERQGRVKGLVLANTPFHRGGRPAIATRLIVLMTRFMPENPIFRRGVARSFFGPETAQRHPEVIRNFLDQPGTFAHEDLLTAIRSVFLTRPSVRDDLARIAIPSLVLAGEADRLYPPERMREDAARLPNHRFEVIPMAGHIAPAERPRETALRIRDWLDATFPAEQAA